LQRVAKFERNSLLLSQANDLIAQLEATETDQLAIYWLKGYYFDVLGDLNSAISFYEKSLSIGEQHKARAAGALAYLYTQQGKLFEATQLNIAALEGDGFYRLLQIAEIFYLIDHEPEAQRWIEHAYQLAPNETRRTGKVSGGFEIDNNTYAQGEDIFIALRQWSAGALYQKQYQVSDAVSLTAGAGLYAYLLDIETDLIDGGKHSKLSSTPVLPSVSAEMEYAFNDKWSVMGRMDYQIFDRDRVFASETGVNYKVNPDWTVALKYAYTNNNWEMYQTRYRSESVLLSVTNRF